MQNDMDKTQFFCEYYKQWIEIYKRGAIREATMAEHMSDRVINLWGVIFCRHAREIRRSR